MVDTKRKAGVTVDKMSDAAAANLYILTIPEPIIPSYYSDPL
jgi:hypothetical protein